MEAAPSRTALFAAVSRGLFRMEATPPWVLDDALALVFVGPVWQELHDQFNPLFPGQVARESRAAVCARSRYAKDRLATGAFTQYVILGAGLDSFAWRRPDLLRSVRVFEVDHPASQAWKLERVRDLALPLSDSQVFVPVDFESEPLRDALRAAGFNGASRRCSPGPALPPISPRRRSSRRCARLRGLPLARRWCSPTGPRSRCSMASAESSSGSTLRSRPQLASRCSPAGRSSRSSG